jgi:hypothetical protein
MNLATDGRMSLVRMTRDVPLSREGEGTGVRETRAVPLIDVCRDMVRLREPLPSPRRERGQG